MSEYNVFACSLAQREGKKNDSKFIHKTKNFSSASSQNERICTPFPLPTNPKVLIPALNFHYFLKWKNSIFLEQFECDNFAFSRWMFIIRIWMVQGRGERVLKNILDEESTGRWWTWFNALVPVESNDIVMLSLPLQWSRECNSPDQTREARNNINLNGSQPAGPRLWWLGAAINLGSPTLLQPKRESFQASK